MITKEEAELFISRCDGKAIRQLLVAISDDKPISHDLQVNEQLKEIIVATAIKKGIATFPNLA